MLHLLSINFIGIHGRCLFLYTDPEFVSSAFIHEDEEYNPTGEDDKIYFFFTEVAKEYDFYTKVKVPRVARVCKVLIQSVFFCIRLLYYYIK